MSWDKYCETNASIPSSDGWLVLVAAAMVVIGVLVLVVVL